MTAIVRVMGANEPAGDLLDGAALRAYRAGYNAGATSTYLEFREAWELCSMRYELHDWFRIGWDDRVVERQIRTEIAERVA